MTEIVELIREFGYPILIIGGLSMFAFLGVFVWFAKHLFDEFKNF
jgi:hypothetical protein